MPKLLDRKATFETLNRRFDSLPDGAYFAAMEEHGFTIDDIIELSDSEVEDEQD
jgi:hypothetical protein